MGFGRRMWVLKWAFLLTICCFHQTGAQTEIQQETGSKYTDDVQQKHNTSATVSSKVNIIQPMLTNPVITPSNPAHNGRVCSTWGNFHFKTFDGDIFSFPGLCNYIFASHCNAPYEDFNIQIRRTVVDNAPTISRITMKLEGVAAELTKGVVMINGNRVQLPYSQSGITIEKSSIYMKVVSKMGIVLMWNEDDNILLELNEKYANQTCGLCGDFNGLPIYNEFYSNSIKMTALQFGNMQKMDGPTEHCEDSTSNPSDNCTKSFDDICQKTLTSTAFAECNDLVDVKEYIKTCQVDLCHSEESKNSSCICDTFAEYSRQCAHAGGHPLNWRTSKLCPKKCPYNMQYQECSSPCADTCTNPERSQFCEEHCMDGCFCPPGTVFDDINSSGCIPQEQCSCVYNGNTYATGASFTEQCHSCTCNGGQWTCQDTSCPGTCSVEGGSHISTYDKKHYDHHGDCTYVLSKHCKDETFTILAELRQCGLTGTETCLKTVTLNMNKGQTLVEVKPDGGVFVNSIYTQLPFSAANVTVFRPSSFFIIMQTNFGVQLEIQIVPIMQVFVRLDPIFKNQTCGLCGNFNNIQTDDFKAISGIIEGTATAFANTWRTQASCPNIQPSFENPCALSIDNEKYAQYWCGLLTDSTGPFAACHYAVNPSVYHTNCMFDTCNCENSEDCLCAALSSYVRACSAKGIQLQGWRTEVCSKYTTSCPKSLSYSYTISACQPTCRSLSEHDVTCDIKFVPVDGCTCVNETYMDESGKCVPANECPCYYRGSPIPFGEAVHENGLVCTCIQGRLNCIGAPNPTPVCESPMVYFNCRNITAGIIGAECQKSCQTLDMQCYSTQCVSGCVCPAGLVLDGNGGCIPEEECPCIHNEAMYQPGEKISVDCNTCVCKNRKWECTDDQCLGTCAVYGDGHYNTFDDKRFSFNGNCEYTLVQDHCGKSGTANGTFRVITENIPCGNTGTTCSKSIKVFLESYELILGEEHVSVVKRGQNDEVPYTVRYMGMYFVIETKSGLILMWDKKTSIFIKLSPNFKGQVCGLCGNYDGNGINDLTTRSLSVVENVLEFGNSWKVSSTCPDASSIKDTCSTNPYRKSWSEKQCSIINSNVFAACHSQVEPAKYYQACVTDACACDTGGDCDCFCTAVAAYAQACSEVGTCIAWRTPSICPLFCDYYNHQGECEWHYKPCGASCMKTCRNPSGKCFHDLPGLEGCYPNCPPDKPYFHEDQMKCVSLCDCYDSEDGKIYRRDECNLCECTSEGLQCKFDEKACNCIYEGNTYKYGELIYNTTDTAGWCFSATCDVNRTISRNIFKCGISTTSPFTFSTSRPTTTTSEITTAKPVTTVCVKHVCTWSEWYDSTKPENKEDSGDYEIFENLRNKGYRVCKNPDGVQCRAKEHPNTEISNLNQTVQCSQNTGLICNNKDQSSKQCYNYEIRISCCKYVPCSEIETTTPSTTEFTTTAVKSTPFTVNTKIKPTTEKKHTQAQYTEVHKTSPKERESTTHPPTSPTTSSTRPPTEVITTRTSTAETSTTATQPPTSPTTASTLPPTELTTTTGTTIVPGTTAPPTQTTSIITTTSTASTARTSPAPIQRTTILTPTPTAPTSASTSTLSTSETTNSCQPRCAWTQWFNVDSPSPGTQNGDMETFERIHAAGYALCEHPQDIQCRAKNYPSRSLDTLGQVVECSLNFGLVCRNEDQITKYPVCFDYEIKLLCCDRSHCQTTSASPGTTTGSSTTSSTAETSTTATQPPTSPTTVSTLPTTELKTTTGTTVVPGTTAPPTQTTSIITTTSTASTARTTPAPIQSTTLIAPTPTVPTTTAISTSNSRTSEGSTTASPATTPPAETSTTATQPPTSPTTASTLPPTELTTTTGTTIVPGTTAPPTQTTSIITTTSTASTARTSPAPIQRTTILTPTPTAPTSASTSTLSTSETTNSCQPRCAWTQWFNVDSPSPGTQNGDMETFERIHAAGYALCEHPQDIQCRAKNYPSRSLDTLGQVVECSLNFGLVCRNEDQITKYPVCFDYEIKLLCCDRSHCQTTSASPGTTTGSSTTSSTAETSTTATQPPTSPTTVSTLPTTELKTTTGTTVVPGTTAPPTQTTSIITTTSTASTARTTPAPIQSTTLIAPTPTVPTTTAISTSNSRTSEGSTTASPATTPPAETSTTATQPPTSPTTASTLPPTELTTTTGTTIVPGTTAPPTQTTSIITTTSTASTARTSPAPIQRTTILTPTPTAPTSASTSTLSTSETTNSCQPRCAWTQWFNVDSPSPGTQNGDMETFERIHAAGYALCEHPQDIQCRAKNYPSRSLDTLGQVVECSLNFGLVCRNEDQITKYPVCFDYEIKLLCCDRSHCQTTSASPGTTTGSSTTSSTAETSTTATQPPTSPTTASTLPPTELTTTTGTTIVPGTTAPPTQTTSIITTTSTASTARTSPAPIQRTTILTPTPTAPTSASTSTLSTSETTNSCQPRCAWTQWFNVDSPSPGTQNGDMETFERIHAAGYALCEQPQDIQCRAKNYPSRSLDTLGQVVECSLNFGLVCRNEDQITKYPVCFDYEIKLLCCDRSHCQTTSASPGTTTGSSTTSSTAETSTTATQPPTSPTTASTLPPTELTTTTGTTIVPGTTAPPTQTTSIITTTSTASTARTSPAPIQRTTILTPTPTAPTSASTSTLSTSETTNSCQPRCAWTQWFNVDSPSPGTQNGDMETFERIHAAGYALCEHPQDIQCRAKNYPSRSLDTLGQVVECSLNFGLVCRNEDQITKYPVCFDYEIKLLCCDRSHCQTTSASPGTTTGSSTTSSTAETSTTATQPPTSPTTVSTIPTTELKTTTGTTVVPGTTAPPTQTTSIITTTSTASTARTTPAPIQSTTLIAPTPTVPTTTAISTSNSRTSEGSTTASPATTPPAETSTTATQPPTSPTTASTLPPTELTTTTGTTIVPGTTAPPTQTTSIITTTSTASTARTSPAPIQRTTILTPTPTAPTSASTSTLSTSETTNSCQPRCAWTQWFNVDSPSPGTQNGDMETFERIHAAGYALCEQPQDIQCRAKNYPSRSLDTLGQVVECSLNFGLVCRNEDQITKYPVCFDYEIKLLCCDRSHCQTTSASPGTTTGSSTTSSTAETSTTATQPPTSPTTVSTLPTTELKTTTGTTVVPGTTAPPTQTTSIITTTSTASTARTTPAPIQSTTLIAPTPTVPTTTAISTSNSRTSEGSTTASPATTPPAETSTTATQPPTSPTTASTLPPTELTTTTGTTIVPGTTAPPTQTTSIITTTSTASTARTSPAPIQRTTILTPTPTAPTSASTSTLSTSETTNSCQPRCAWTQWFNVDSPSPGTQNGDMETFERIHAAGYALCEHPQDIQCRAKDYPSRSLDTLGQVVECSLNFGLVCRNEDQITKYPICFDYEIKLLCCDRSHCQTTSASPGTTTGSSTTSSTAETSTTATQPPTSPTTASTLPPTELTTTTGTTIVPGTTAPPTQTTSIITTTSTASTARTSPAPIQRTTILTPTPTAPTSASTSTLSTSETTNSCQPRCAWTQWFNVDSPSPGTQNGDMETFERIHAAGYALCEHPQDIQCRAKDYPSRSLDTLGQVVECSLNFGLVCRNEDQITKYPICFDYEIKLLCCDRSHCQTTSASPGTTTGSSTTSSTAETSTTATQPPTSPTTASTLPPTELTTTTGTTIVPGTTAPPTQTTSIITTTSTASTARTTPAPIQSTTLIAPTPTVPTTTAISTSNSRTSEGSSTASPATTPPAETSTTATQPPTSPTTASTLPPTELTTTTGTTIVPGTTAPPTQTTSIITTTSTASTARTSPAPIQRTTILTPPTATVPTTEHSSTSISTASPGSTTTSPATSPPAETSTVVTQPPTSPTTASSVPKTVATTGTPQSSHFTTRTSAIFSSSTSTPVTTEASTYVTSSRTTPCFCHVLGHFYSPGEVVYNTTDQAGCNFYALCTKECEIDPFQGPCPSTTPFTSVTTETTIQATSSTERVISSASPTIATSLTTSVERNCTDVNPPRKPGENWTSECKMCVCDPVTVTVQCQPLPCQTVQTPICDTGFVSVPVLPEDPCCPEFECRRIPDTCVINGTMYTVGKSTIINSCKKCTCTSDKDPVTDENIVHCERVQCETSCPLGHQYMTEDGECCGKCIEVACKIKLSNNTVHVLNVNEILPLDNCSHYKCEKIEDQFVAVQTKRVCPEYNPGECIPDEAETTPDGCCKICKPPKCKPYSKKTVIRHGDCESSEPVELTYCEGNCLGYSVYSFEANQMQHECSCCQESGTQTREVTLTCQNGTSINYNYVYVEQCQCMNACIPNTSAPDDSQVKKTGSQWKISGRKR